MTQRRRRMTQWLTGMCLGASLLITATGTSCETVADSPFGQAAVGPIGDGVKTIFSGLVDGITAAVQSNSSDDSSDSTTTNRRINN